MVSGGVRTQWLVRDHGMPAGDIGPAEIGKPFIYYFGAGWDKSGDFPDAKSWNNYISLFAERRDQPLQVTIGN